MVDGHLIIVVGVDADLLSAKVERILTVLNRPGFCNYQIIFGCQS